MLFRFFSFEDKLLPDQFLLLVEESFCFEYLVGAFIIVIFFTFLNVLPTVLQRAGRHYFINSFSYS